MHSFMLIPSRYGVGLTSTSLGLVRTLQRAGLKVGYFKPVQQSIGNTELLTRTLNISVPTPLSLAHVEQRLSDNQLPELLEEWVSLQQQAAQGCDVLIIEGLVPSPEVAYASRLNSQLARALSAQAILVSAPDAEPPTTFAERLEIQARLLEGVSVAGVILGKVTDTQWLSSSLSALVTHKLHLLASVTWQAELHQLRTLDLARQLGASFIHQGHSQRRVAKVILGAGTAEATALQLQAGSFLVCPVERAELLISAALASLNGTPLAGVLLCGATEPNAALLQLCANALDSGLPLLHSSQDCATCIVALHQLEHKIANDDLERAEQMADFVADQLSPQWFLQRCGQVHEPRLTPALFRYQLVRRAQAANKRIVLPEGHEPRTIEAAIRCQTRAIANCVLLGNAQHIHNAARAMGLTWPSDLEIIDPQQVRERYVAPMVEMRKHKGLNAPMALAQLEDNVVLGTMMLALDEVDGLVSGALNTTANTIRPALQLIKTAAPYSLVSSVFFMLLPDQVLVYGDCAVNPEPSAAELAEIALQSAASAEAFGVPARVAMISYSTGSSGSGAEVEKVREATRLAQQQHPTLLLDGPLQYDAAAIVQVGQQKAPDSPVAGRATVFIFPDLNTGNTTYKAVQRSADCISIGPMLQGLRKPVNDLSRGALVEDIVYTIALTAVQAASQENKIELTSQP